MTSLLHKPWRWLHALALIGGIIFSLCVCATGRAQTAAPGLAYTPQQMAERLVELAEGPPPPMGDLEREFGFTFVRGILGRSNTYRGRAGFPFAPLRGGWGGNISFDDFEGNKSYAFQFINEQQQFELRTWYCIQNEWVFRRLGSQWERRVKDGVGHFPTEVTYTRQVNGLTRRISAYPIFSEAGCLRLFDIDYDISTLASPKGPQK